MAVVNIEPEVRLKRYLYFCSEESRHICTSRREHDCCQLSKITSLFELISADKENSVLEIIDAVKNDPLCARRESLLFLLAVLARNAKTKEVKTLAYSKAIEICISVEELYLFLKFAHSLNKNISHGLRRVICTYYLSKEPEDFLDILTLKNSYYGWTHQDVFKLVHLKVQKNTGNMNKINMILSKNLNIAQEIIVSYIMKNIKHAKKTLEEMEENENSDKIRNIFNKVENYDTLRHCRSDEQVATLIKENSFKVCQIPSNFLKSQIVWDAVIPNLEITELLPELVRLNRLGFLKSNNPNSALNKVVEILTDTKRCITNKIHPVVALIYLKTFERGKPIDPHKQKVIAGLLKSNEEGENQDSKKKEREPIYFNQPKNNAIISALYKLLQHSFKNIQSTGRRFLIAIDCREDYMKNLCYISKTVTCFEAATLVAFSLVKAEKDVTVAVFDGAGLTIVPLEKAMTYSQALQKIMENKGGYVLLNNTFNWALKNNKQVDVFLNILYSADSLNKIPKNVKGNENIISSLKRYRQKVHLPNTKMINVSLGGRKLAIADGTCHVLDICGFDHHVPKLIEACCKGLLQ